MERILILGGGVGGTIVANLLVKRLRPEIQSTAMSRSRSSTSHGSHVYQPGFMYIALGSERAERLKRPESSLLDERVELVVGEVLGIDQEKQTSSELTHDRWLGYDQLVLATGSRIVPEADRALRDRGPPLLHRRGGAQAAGGARRLHRRTDRHRHRGHALQMPARAARGHLPDRGRAPRAQPAREKRDPLLLADRARLHDRDRQRHGHARARAKGIELHTFFNVETIDPDRKVVQSLEGEELPYDLLVLVPPHRGAQFLIDSGLAPAPGGWLPTDRHTLQVGGRPERLRARRRHGPAALEGRFDGAFRGARRRRAHRRRRPGSRAEAKHGHTRAT